jgi:hypothetical protein
LKSYQGGFEMDQKTALKQQVEFFCRQICDELGMPQEEEVLCEYSKEPFTRKNWMPFQRFVEDWLVTEAFRKVRSKYWDSESRKSAKQIMLTEGE